MGGTVDTVVITSLTTKIPSRNRTTSQAATDEATTRTKHRVPTPSILRTTTTATPIRLNSIRLLAKHATTAQSTPTGPTTALPNTTALAKRTSS